MSERKGIFYILQCNSTDVQLLLERCGLILIIVQQYAIIDLEDDEWGITEGGRGR